MILTATSHIEGIAILQHHDPSLLATATMALLK